MERLLSAQHFEPPRQRPQRGRAALAAGVVALFLAAPLMTAGDSWDIHEPAIGAFERSTLPDGSRVELNTDSRLRFRMTATGRVVELERGKVFVDVVHDAYSPFPLSGAT